MPLLISCRVAIAVAFVTLGSGLLAGCERSASHSDRSRDSRQERPSDAEDGVKRMLADRLRALAARHSPPATVDTARVKFSREASQAVPGMTYHWAMFGRPDAHGPIFAVAGRKDTVARIVDTVQDWEFLADNWEPQTEDDVRRACTEVIRVASSGRNPLLPPTPITDTTALSQKLILRQDALAEAGRTPTTVTSPSPRDSSWSLTAWYVEAGQTVRYRCVFRHSAVTLQPIDSIRDAGFVPAGS
jgi:hypothetical protein